MENSINIMILSVVPKQKDWFYYVLSNWMNLHSTAFIII